VIFADLLECHNIHIFMEIELLVDYIINIAIKIVH